MYEDFQKVFNTVVEVPGFSEEADAAHALNNAFLSALAGTSDADAAMAYLTSMRDDPEWGNTASYYADGLGLINEEIDARSEEDSEFKQKISDLAGIDADIPVENLWAVFFPEGVGIKGHEEEKAQELKQKRTVSNIEANPDALTAPASQLLFTSNVLLTLPFSRDSIDGLSLSEGLKDSIKASMDEPQEYWFDHPIPLDVDTDSNEVIYGLRGLDEAISFEIERGNASPDQRATCVLSVSVTHPGIAGIAREFLSEELKQAGGLKNIDVYVFTEVDTKKIVEEIIAPMLENKGDAELIESVFGVDGAYGRHYSFLKAIAAFWNVFIDSDVKATFKIDLDQVFPQKELVEETGKSAFEHFMTSLWGAKGTDSWGNKIELGMIAGSLVNEKDIAKSIYTADAVYPDKELSADEHFFYSTLPHAFSTEAELLTRYDTPQMDGKSSCIQRVHVTGGTNGIHVNSLMRHRPFTPTFFGRAEDQAYILSVLLSEGTRLGYAHEAGLIMRHDKEAFAQGAIEAAHIGRAAGDYVRILYFSEYARVLSGGDLNVLKDRIDPFTGCFVSQLPVTITYLRFSLKAAALLSENPKGAVEFLQEGSRRMLSALEFTSGAKSPMFEEYGRQKVGWNLYYDALIDAESRKEADPLLLDTVLEAKRMISNLKIAT